MYNYLKNILGLENAKLLFEVFFILNQTFVLLYKKVTSKKNLNREDNKKQILLALIPEHGNLGDYALYLSAKEMISDFYPNYVLSELKISETSRKIFDIRSSMNSQTDMVFLIGGGNMGTRYITEEFIRLLIFYIFRRFKRIQLPQSFSFERKSFLSKFFSFVSKKIYLKNSQKLLITVRDQVSLELFKKHFNLDVFLFPDNVFYFDVSSLKKPMNNTKILYCLREDEESNFNKLARISFINEINKEYPNAEEFNTMNNGYVTNEKALAELLKEINSARYVIVDSAICFGNI